MQRSRIRVGTSGWVYRDWRGAFYPRELAQARWFGFYAERFDTVEVNNSFYRLPSDDAFDAWKEAAPAGFVYALKASRYLTHMKKLREPEEPIARFFSGARRLGRHLGPVLYQLPPNWPRDVERLRAFLAALPAGVAHVMEFRDPSWFHDDVRAALAEARVGFCVHDMPGAACPKWVTGATVYVRFHGPGEARYAGRYGRRRLGPHAAWIREQAPGRAVYAYFNNDIGGAAVHDALTLRELLET
jgi:uncharacterized protein YecE (DUF72 family)